MGVSQKAFNEKQRKRLFASYGRRELPATVTKDEIRCQKCGFRARYAFVRCPECGEAQK